MPAAQSQAPQGAASHSSAAAPAAAKTMLATEIAFGVMPLRASAAAMRCIEASPRAAMGRRLASLSFMAGPAESSAVDSEWPPALSSGGAQGTASAPAPR